MARQIDDNSQYSRKTNIIIDGLTVKSGDNDDSIRRYVLQEIKKLKLDIESFEVDRAHRTAKPYFDKNGKHHTPVVCRFTNWYARNEFYNASKQSSLFITADLTTRREHLLNSAKDRINVEGSRESKFFAYVFADRNCHITVKTADGRYFKVNSLDEFDRLIDYVEDTQPPYEEIWKVIELAKRSTNVVNLSGMSTSEINKWLSNASNVYIGRDHDGISKSSWANPFLLKDNNFNRSIVARKYEDHVTSSKDLSNNLGSLRGKILGCFCSPALCHGDILQKLIGN